MEQSRQPDLPPERLEKMTHLERLQFEEETAGSTIAYLHSLGVYYRATPEHASNMLQLQRIARLIATPQDDAPCAENEAFYWGEILGYTFCDRMIGEPWHEMSYHLFNNDVRTRHQKFPDDEMSLAKRRQLVATQLLDELDMLEAEEFPPMLDEYIQEKAAAISDIPYVQDYIIFGFRYIIKQVAETVTDDTLAANQFFDIMAENEIDDIRPELEPLNDIRVYLMERFADHMARVGTFDENDETAVDHVIDYLTTQLNRDLVHSERMTTDDDIIARGKVMYISIDPTTDRRAIHILPQEASLHGSVSAIAIVDVPVNEMIPELRARPGGSTEDIAGFQVNRFGVTLLLDGAYVVADKGGGAVHAYDKTICLVLNNPQLQLMRYKTT